MDDRAKGPTGAGQNAPGEAPGQEQEVGSYLVGFALAAILTAGSFWAAGTSAIWAPAVPIMLIALAIGQMGVHLVFFLHITSGPDNANNSLALAFGVMIVILVVGGSLWIMSNLDANMVPMEELMRMQR